MMSKLLPQLRFKGFSEPWVQSELQKISTKNISYGVVQTGENLVSGVPCVRVVDLTKNGFKRDDLIRTSTSISKAYKKTILEPDELMIALRGEIGLTRRVTEELVGCNLTRGIARVAPNTNELNSNFLEIYLNSDSLRKIFDQRKNGSALKEIPISELKKIPIRYPSYEEQKKIAGFLSSVDKKINLLKEKHVLLTKYKKGVMQKLFRQEIRFKDDNGNDFPDWESVTLNDLMIESRIKGSTGDKARKMTVKLWGKGVFEKDDKLGGSENTQYYKRKSGQFIYSKLDFLNCAFGIVPDELDGLETTVDLPCFDIESGINKYFILEYIKQKRFYKKYGDMADGSRKAKRIHAETFLNFPVNLPCEKEQDKIADFLTAIDKKLNAVNQQVELTQTFKKGLLQQMFV